MSSQEEEQITQVLSFKLQKVQLISVKLGRTKVKYSKGSYIAHFSVSLKLFPSKMLKSNFKNQWEFILHDCS